MGQDKNKERIAGMFNSISGKYDFLNHFLSFGIDRYWRSKVIRLLAVKKPDNILDVATGTGDLAIAMVKLSPHQITGIDIADKMLEIGREKVKNAHLDEVITFKTGDALHIPFPDETFDTVTVAFGVRNYEDLEAGLREMKRVMIRSGSMVILEFSKPAKMVGFFYRFYSKRIIPLIGKLISRHDFAYRYLPESVASFPSGMQFLSVMEGAGLAGCKMYPLSFGIATIYVGEKHA
jgi:demethylmenaquinone methyltransferase / 2-methoxy-6-polyprenyl-1,4-benzoquinol methylase